MEFHEKLQELRKNRGLTQEELADALYVSRTTISKWESGRGYPSIDSLREISRFFSVTIDDLLSGEKLLAIAETENKSNMRSICDLLFGMVDICSFLLIVLPLYPNRIDSYIQSVDLFMYTDASSWIRLTHWVIFASLIILGAAKTLLTQLKIQTQQKLLTGCSIVLSIAAVLFLALTREAYAAALLFLLLVAKGVLLLKCADHSGQKE